MADIKFAKAPTFKSPKGTFKFPRLGEPDTKFKEEGEYSVKLVLDAAAAAKLGEKLEPLHAQAVKDGKAAYAALPVASRKKLDAKGGLTINQLFTPVYGDDEQETGEVEINIKMTASGVRKKDGKPWKRSPAVFDAAGNKMDGKKVWGGSVGIVAFEVGTDVKTGRPGYFIPGTGACGLSLRLQAVQVIELVSGGQKSAKSYGFEQEEGYEDEGSALDNEAGAPAEAGDPGPQGDGSSDF
jgi:hypothetical protein